MVASSIRRCAPLPPAQAQHLSQLTRRRRQLIQMITAEQHRLDQAAPPLAKTIRRHITYLQKQLKTLDKDVHTLIRTSPLWCDQAALLESVPRRWERLPRRCY